MERSRDRAAGPSPLQHEAELLVSCARCGRLHSPERPLESNHVCEDCARGHALLRLEMDGVFPLTAATIEQELEQEAPGNYALGDLDRDGFVDHRYAASWRNCDDFGGCQRRLDDSRNLAASVAGG